MPLGPRTRRDRSRRCGCVVERGRRTRSRGRERLPGRALRCGCSVCERTSHSSEEKSASVPAPSKHEPTPASSSRLVNAKLVYWANSTDRRNTSIVEVSMGRPAGWMRELTDRAPIKSPGKPSLRRDVERRFWREIVEGSSSEDAALVVGASQAAGARWFRQRGGMPTLMLDAISGRYLSFAEREEIALLEAQGAGVAHEPSARLPASDDRPSRVPEPSGRDCRFLFSPWHRHGSPADTAERLDRARPRRRPVAPSARRPGAPHPHVRGACLHYPRQHHR